MWIGGNMSEWLTLEPTGSRAYLAVPESGVGPGVLVLHAWWGLTSVFTDVCDRLAAAGFVALAADLYAEGATTDSIPGAEALMQSQDNSAQAAIVQASVDKLCDLPDATGSTIGVIGFSLGGYWAFNLSQTRPTDIGAVVAVYGAGEGDFSLANAAYLGHFAENDDYEDIAYVRELETSIRDAGREVTFHLYPGTGHWFAEPNRPDVYNAEATELVWERTIAFLNKHLG